MNPTDPLPPEPADDTSDNPARTVIAAFGGIRPMAAKLGVPVTTVQGWKKRGVIPANRRDEIAAAAATHDIALADDLLAAAAPDEDDRGGDEHDPAAPAEAAPTPTASTEATSTEAASTDSPWERPAEPVAGPSSESGPEAAPTDPMPDPEAPAPVVAGQTAEPDTDGPLPPPVRTGRGLARAALLVALLAAVAVGTRPLWETVVWGSGADDGLAARVAALEAAAGGDPELAGRVDGLAAAVAEASDRQDTAAASLRAELDGLVQRLDALPREAGTEDLSDLRDRLASLEEAVASGAAGDAGVAVALGDRLSALEATVTDLSGRVADQAGDGQAVSAVADEVAAVRGDLADVQTGLDERMAGLEAGLTDVAAQAALPSAEVIARLDRIEADLAAAAGVVDDLQQALAGITAMESRLAALETLGQATDTANVALRDSVAEIGRRLDRANQDLSGLDTGVAALRDDIAAARAGDVADQALLLALGQVRDAVADGSPYEPALGALAGLAPSGPETAAALDVLSQHAATGVPTALDLLRRFPAMAEQVRHAAAIPADGDWMDEALASVQGLVVIRRAPGEVAGDDADAVLARAEARIRAGDVASAVAALASLESPAVVDAAQGWLGEARAHLAVAEAIRAVNGAVLARIAAAGSGISQ